MSYPLVCLGDVADFINGVAFKPEDWGTEGKPIIRIQNLNDPSKEYNYTHREVKDTNIARKGDLLVSWSASLGVYEWNGQEACINQHIFKVVPNDEKIDKTYLKRALELSIVEMENQVHGATMKHITRGKFLGNKIPLPPLAEQRRIASILDQADVLCQKRQQTIEKLNQLLQATFIDMFGDPVSNPKGWDLVRVGEVVNEFIGGKNIECPDESDSDYKILKVSAVTSKVYKPHESKFAPNTFEPNPLAIVEKGDLLFSRANTTELVAATAYVWETPENIVLPDKLWKFSISDESKVNKLYLWDLFKNIEFRNELSKLSSGTSGSMKNISKGKLNELKMPLPPKELQDKFAEFSTKLWGQIKTFQQSSDSLDSLFNSLQNQAFNGSL
ncbi:restriction endonuclease subunit S [Acinetobacter haemolyticus]|uniref:restriction endonuclease subunit S n=1 Tax=Acinetobacter haemolyticus TaxID=29430 RepID=UPI00137377C5|nr:restriction endonuclease subunit S [Acinetobacter haemolyticus]